MSKTHMRDEQSGAVINTDIAALNKYKQERALHRKVAQLNNEVATIKQCLQNVDERLEKIENKINVKA